VRASRPSARGTSGGGCSSPRASPGPAGRAWLDSRLSHKVLQSLASPDLASRGRAPTIAGYEEPANVIKRMFVLSIAVPLAAAGCTKTSQGAGTVRGSARSLTVRVEPVNARDVVYRIQAVGTLEADEVVQVTAEVEGVVSSVNFDEGLRVSPQTVLARIDPDRYRLQAEQAEASYKKALADARRAASDQQRREQLAKEQLVGAGGPNRSRQGSGRLTREADPAKAARGQALQNRRPPEVRPPHVGVINTKAVDTGQFVKTGNVLATLVDNSRLRLRFKVSEAESLRAAAGQTVGFHVAALGSQDFTAQIYHV